MSAGFGLLYMFGGFAPITPTTTTCTGGLISIDLARRYLGYPSDDVRDDDEICRMIKSASARFRNAVGSQVTQETAKLLEDYGNGKITWTPKYRQINGISKLEYWNTNTNAWVEIDTSRYRLIQPDDISSIEFLSYFQRSLRYRATLDIGYADIPQDIQEIVLNDVALAYFDSGLGKKEWRLGILSRGKGAGTGDQSLSVTYSRDVFNGRWNEVVANYRNWW